MRGLSLVIAVCVTSGVLSPFSPLSSLSTKCAHAEDDAERNKALATDLFDKGLKKMEAGKCDEATIKDAAACREARENFKRAYALYPAALGALRNLAYVEKGLGLIASASRNFREVARRAPLDPKPERRAWADFARKEADGLEPRIPKLTIKLPTEAVAGMKVTLDGVNLPEAALGTSIDVDPGTRKVHAEAPGRSPFDGSVTLGERQSKSVVIVLDVDRPTGPTETSGGSKLAPILVTSIGGAVFLGGLGIGYLSLAKKNDVCDAKGECDPQGYEDGRSLAKTATIVTSIGAAVAIGGLVWWVLSPTSDTKKDKVAFTPMIGSGVVGALASGRF